MRRPPRIAVYTDAPRVGGAERSLANLVAALSPRFDVVVLAVESTVIDEVVAGRPSARSELLPFIRSRRDVRAIAAHAKALWSVRPDVFHANLISPWSCQMAILLALLAPRVRVVAVEQLPVPPADAQQRRLKRLTASRLHAHVAVGERSAREVERLVGLSRGAVRTIHNGVPDRGAPADEGGSTHGAIGAVGRLEVQKGFDVLLRALAMLPDATASIVGDGPERGRLALLAADLGVADRVRWVGWSNTPTSFLPEFDVVAFPSRFEGFPLAVLEAMLAERPVVASDVGSVREAVRHGDTGLLVPADDPGALASALADLLADRELRRTLGARARTLVLERYTDTEMARSFEALYAELGV